MLSTQFLLPTRIVDDEARPRTRNKRLVRAGRTDTKPRLFVPTTTKKRVATPKPRSSMPLSDSNPLLWMQEECPEDVLPKILSFCGPQMASTLNQTNSFWRELMDQQSTWRIISEELYKWKDGDELPPCWKEYYRLTPCVPTDYNSIPAALAVASDHNEATIHDESNMNPRVMEQRRSLRILLRPGDYALKEAIVIQAVGDAVITIETMDLPKIDNGDDASAPLSQPPSLEATASLDTLDSAATPPPMSPAKRILKKASAVTRKLTCRSVHVVQDDAMDEDLQSPEVVFSPSRAKLISKTRRHNEPVLRVRQGVVKLVNLSILHNSHGIDIWNGNAAIQIQPPMGPDDAPHNTRPTAMLHKVDVQSRSGRGICNIDGGICRISHCHVHDCAATGIYVGGPGSTASIDWTDVVQNGNGNRSRRGIARGHSGIYLEQGRASVVNCNISQNSLTGISAVSLENAIIHLEQSDLVANGTTQLEMPPDGSLSRRRSLTRDNFVANAGLMRTRSGLVE